MMKCDSKPTWMCAALLLCLSGAIAQRKSSKPTKKEEKGTKCYNCISVSQLNGKSLYTQGWKPKDEFPIIADCWEKPKQARVCQKGCVKIIAIGPANEKSILRELKKANAKETTIRMIHRTCGEYLDTDLKPDSTHQVRAVFGLPDCRFARGAISVVGAGSSISACTCKGDQCNGEKGVVYSVQSTTTCRVSMSVYGQLSYAPPKIASKKPGKKDGCDAFCKKNPQCATTGFDPKEHPNALCFMSDSVDDCMVTVDDKMTGRVTKAPTDKNPKAVFVFCNACS